MIRGFKRIIDKYKKRNQRGKGKQLIGIKSLECNFNPKKKWYNPHFHIIVPDEETAKILVKEWRKLWGNKWTDKAAQDIRKVKSIERDLIECVKYGSKIFTEPDVNKKSKQKIPPHIYISALDNILTAMKGHRLFDRFGFNLPDTNKNKDVKFTLLNQFDEWEYNPKQYDWINTETEKALSGYILPPELNLLLNYNIDTTLQ